MKQALPLNPDVEIFRWGPVPGKYFYVAGDCHESFFIDVPRRYQGVVWPDTLFLIKDGKMIWLTEFPQMWKKGEELFFQHIFHEENRQIIWQEWLDGVKALNNFEQQLEKVSLNRLKTEELIQLAHDFYQTLVTYWGPSIFPELGNYGAEKYLERKVGEAIQDEQEARRVMEIITAPEELSFYQQEEVDLLCTTDLAAHQQKYFWLKNHHNHTEVLSESYFAERKATLAANLIEKLQAQLQHNKQKKAEIKASGYLSDELIAIGAAFAKSIVWQDQRKAQTFLSLHYKYLFLQEVAHRLNLPEAGLFNFNFPEVIGLLQRENPTVIVAEREHGMGILCRSGQIENLTQADIANYWETFAEEKVTAQNSTVAKGIVASKGEGVVRGKVQLLLDPMLPFEEGAILITTMTSPEYIFAMKKAAAIVTDNGGLMSHAAIVSRELHTPCIVGSKIATQIFKTGDLVEVDTTHGTVKLV